MSAEQMFSARNVGAKSYAGANGVNEHVAVIVAPEADAVSDQIDYISRHYAAWAQGLGLSSDSAVFRRLFVSDAINQMDSLRASPLLAEAADDPVAISVVQQPPLPAARVGLLAYHVDGAGPLRKTRLSPHHMMVELGGLGHLWSTHLCCGQRAATAPEEVQTSEIFGNLIEQLGRQGATLADNCVRTWIYMKDVDVFYRGMVNSRRQLFRTHGLTEDTHYIASTGIQGCCEHQFDLVLMDAYSIVGLKPGQMSYLNDFERLCPTKDYSVTFERGTRIAFADRAHHYISGTASIDKYGNTVHLGDVMAQLDLALINVDALLRSGGATLADMMYLIVYLRDSHDQAKVRRELERRLPGLPFIIVEGAVCRPEWLIEIEGVAVAPRDDPAMPHFGPHH
jgi:enamine deaminase RidA (YjgF/YER057c/UK114 family)